MAKRERAGECVRSYAVWPEHSAYGWEVDTRQQGAIWGKETEATSWRALNVGLRDLYLLD